MNTKCDLIKFSIHEKLHINVLHLEIISRSISEDDNLQDMINKNLCVQRQTASEEMKIGHQSDVWGCLKDSETNLSEGCCCDIVANWVSDDYQISIIVPQQIGDNEQR